MAIDAQDREGIRSRLSQPVSVTPQAPDLPLAPLSFLPLPGDGQVTMVWRTSIRVLLKGCNIFWGVSEDALDNKLFVEAAKRSQTINGLQNGRTYYFSRASGGRPPCRPPAVGPARSRPLP